MAAPEILASLIDYAGLFPPAQLAMEDAKAGYRAAREGPHAWMVERFIVPASRLREVADEGWPLAVVADLPPEQALAALAGVDGVELLEARAEPEALAAAPAGVEVFVEVPAGDDAALERVAAAGRSAKVRCGGTTFPSDAELGAFISGCARLGLRWKATAGLHHPFRAPDRHGFVNLLAAAGLAQRGEDVEAVLGDEDPRHFGLTEGRLTWRGEDVGDARTHFVGYGSCSFAEPVEDLQRMGWL